MISCPEAVESLLWLTVTVWDGNISVEDFLSKWSRNVYFWWKVWLHPNKKALIYGNVAFFCIWFWTHTLHTYKPQVWSCAHFWSSFTCDFTLQIHMPVSEVSILSGQCPDNLKTRHTVREWFYNRHKLPRTFFTFPHWYMMGTI